MTSVALFETTDISTWLRSTFLEIVLVVLGGIILGRAAEYTGRTITARIDRDFQDSDALVRSEAAKHRHALTQVLTWVFKIVIYFLVALQVLELTGFNLAGLTVPASVLGAGLGFGAQRIVQDILAGFFIITERQYGYGDTVHIVVTSAVEAEGTVEDVTLRITKVRSPDGEVITIPNGQIIKVDNLSKDWARAAVDVPVPTGADIGRVNEILHEVGARAYQDRKISALLLDEPTVMGVESLEVDRVNIRMVARTLPGKQFQVGRLLRERIVAALGKEGIGLAAPVATESLKAPAEVAGDEE
ncbi:mechanosensitive ion channel family protein [Aldersonia sp. NBC_00410]|uniref:mechanosensitive ion channel family protein n=1 Tax=Aldersonia sp. NBC_00410 TaxID=2975954 RepID=UPI002256961B|nr:mechanosensitive ion channel family protein [Aldersonia sp. NBC_00410]MCX5044634.1 mechanosensitive ion channel family protein [Aldersonia sp. NBC_00410]